MKSMRESEVKYRPKPFYMNRQPHITHSMRRDLVEWLLELSYGLNLQGETVHLAVSYIDRFASRVTITRLNLQLVGLAALFIAAKFEEMQGLVVADLVLLCDESYNKDQILNMEKHMLKYLKFSLCAPTSLAFINAFHEAVDSKPEVKFMSQYLIDLALAEGGRYLGYLPSKIAAAAIAVARMNSDLSLWSAKLEEVTGYDIDQLRNPIILLSRTQTKEFQTRESAIYLQYGSRPFLNVSKVTPLHISGPTLDQATHYPNIFRTEDDSLTLRELLSELYVNETRL